MSKPFKMRSQSAVKESGFKMMGSSPLKIGWPLILGAGKFIQSMLLPTKMGEGDTRFSTSKMVTDGESGDIEITHKPIEAAQSTTKTKPTIIPIEEKNIPKHKLGPSPK